MRPILPLTKRVSAALLWQSICAKSLFPFWEKDLADLTSTIMADCTFLEQSFSHFIPEACRFDHFYGSDFHRSALYGLENGAGCLYRFCRLPLRLVGFSAKIPGKSEPESDGREDGLRRRDTGSALKRFVT